MSAQPASDASQAAKNPKQTGNKPDSTQLIRRAAFWIIIVVLVILWLVAWLWYKCGDWSHLLLLVAIAAALIELLTGGTESKNLDPRKDNIPDWDPARPEESLAQIHLYVIKEAANSAGWYLRYKGSKAFWSRIIRFCVWALAAVGGLLPVLAMVLKDHVHSNIHLGLTNGLWASLLLGVAAALLGLDKGFGFSSGWARYILTATNIRKALEEFRLDWAALKAKAGTPLKTADQVAPLIERAKQFRSEVEGLVLQETKDWVTEFQSTMQQMEKDVAAQLSALKTQVDKTIQAKEEASKGGAIHLTVTNSLNALPGSLKVTVVDNESKTRQEEYLTVDFWTSKFLPPGIYQVKLDALFGSPPAGTTPPPQIVTVRTGEVTTVKFDL